MIGYEGAPRFASAVRALTGDAEIVPPGLVLELDSQPRDEWCFLKRDRLWFAAQGLAAGGAGNTNQMLLTQGSDTTMLVQLLAIFSDVALFIGLQALSGAVAGAASQSADGRGPPPQTKFFTKQAATVLGGIPQRWVVPANTVMSVRNGTLPPFISTNGRILIETQAANIASNVNVWGRERKMRPEEQAEG